MRFLFPLLIILICPFEAIANDEPPDNIIEHFRWNMLPKYRSDAISRLEGFWKKHHPVNEEYDDSIHGRFVLLCAYRLCGLYADEGRAHDSKKMLDWIRSTDPRLIEEERKDDKTSSKP